MKRELRNFVMLLYVLMNAAGAISPIMCWLLGLPIYTVSWERVIIFYCALSCINFMYITKRLMEGRNDK